MASPKNLDFVVTGDSVRAKATAEQALVARKFRVTWQDDWAGMAERGSKVGNMVAGAAAQYFKVGLRIMSGTEPGHTIVRIEKQSSGWMGGAIGASRTTKNFASLKDELSATFESAGVLVSVQTA